MKKKKKKKSLHNNVDKYLCVLSERHVTLTVGVHLCMLVRFLGAFLVPRLRRHSAADYESRRFLLLKTLSFS